MVTLSDTTQDNSGSVPLLDNQLCFAMYSASLAMTKAYQPLLAALGLTYPQYLVMLVVWERDGMTVSEIGKRLFLDSGTLTPLIKRLDSAGLIVRLRDVEDERRVRVKLTAAGHRLKTDAVTLPGCITSKIGCEPEELFSLNQAVRQLRKRLTG